MHLSLPLIFSYAWVFLSLYDHPVCALCMCSDLRIRVFLIKHFTYILKLFSNLLIYFVLICQFLVFTLLLQQRNFLTLQHHLIA